MSVKRIAENETMMTIPATIDFTTHSVADEPADDSSDTSVSAAHSDDTRSAGIASSVTELIGDTPLVRLNRIARDVDATIAVKVEYLNPGGSSKDRIAQRIIEAAERSGQLKPGGVIVEPTSGNTGVGLALVAQQRGYRTIFVLPDKVSESKRAVLRAYGAEVVVTPTNVEPQDPRSYYQVSDRLARTIPGAFKPNQYSNENGPLSHYETTGPEIWRDSGHRVTHFVAGIGTGGTISGTGRYLKEVSDGAVTVVGADPEGSIYSDPANVHVYDIEGVGEDFYPQAFDQSIPDSIVQISDEQAFLMTRRLAREEGLLVGGSSGMAVAAAMQYAREHQLTADDLVVVLLPDSGRGYLDKIFDDEWMRAHGYADVVEATTPEPLQAVQRRHRL
jgi:cystathionine beta-synthase